MWNFLSNYISGITSDIILVYGNFFIFHIWHEAVVGAPGDDVRFLGVLALAFQLILFTSYIRLYQGL